MSGLNIKRAQEMHKFVQIGTFALYFRAAEFYNENTCSQTPGGQCEPR